MLALLVAALALGFSAQPDGASPSSLVRLVVTATDERGQGVDDLEADDFRVLEGDIVRPVESVHLVRASGDAPADQPVPILSAADERAAAEREGTRTVGIFLDEFHVAPDAAAGVRQAMYQFLAGHLGPGDLVVLLKPLDSLLRLRATHDLDAVRSAIASFEGRKGQLEPRSDFEETFIAASPERVAAVRSDISAAALQALVTHLARLPGGRKAVIVASEGFDVAGGRRGVVPPSPAALARMSHRAGIAIHVLDLRPDPPQVPGETGVADGPDELPGRTMLRELATGTQGLMLFGPGAWRDGFDRIMAGLSHYYVLEFQGGAPADGRFQQVQVSVTRPGVSIDAPAGYWTDSALDRLRAASSARSAMPPAPPLPVRRTSPLIRPWFGVARGDDGFARVSFVWEPVDRQAGARRQESSPAQVRMRVLTLEGTPVYEGVVPPAAVGADEASLVSFDAPEGRLRIELTIEDAAAVRLDTDVRDVVVSVPDGDVALGTAAVYRARTARDLRSLRDDPGAVPTSSRTFSRIEQLLIRVPVYGTGSEAALDARVVSRAGRVMRTLAAERGPLPGLQQFELPLAGLPAGEYRLELTASESGRSVSEALDFRVVP